jgi:hypothetical protein
MATNAREQASGILRESGGAGRGGCDAAWHVGTRYSRGLYLPEFGELNQVVLRPSVLFFRGSCRVPFALSVPNENDAGGQSPLAPECQRWKSSLSKGSLAVRDFCGTRQSTKQRRPGRGIACADTVKCHPKLSSIRRMYCAHCAVPPHTLVLRRSAAACSVVTLVTLKSHARSRDSL